MNLLKKQLNLKILLIFWMVIFVAGCTSNGTGRKQMRPKNFISQEEIKELAFARTAKDAIEIARPIWLRRKGMYPSIYMNGILMSGLDPLDNISINSVKEMRFLPAAEATTMYGTNNMGGVIEIKSR
jgi:hypothetical protein